MPQRGGEHLPASYRLLQCDRCGLWFKDGLPDQATLRRHYQGLPVERSPWNSGARLPHERVIDLRLAELPAGSNVLDVGCWTGRLLSPHGRRLRTFGVEPNDSAAGIAGRAGLEILGKDTADLAQNGRRFELILMVDLFEHLRDPVRVVKDLLQLLSPGGSLLLVSGRTDCFPVRMVGASYWYFACADHLVFLNRRFVRWLGRHIGPAETTYRPLRHFDFSLRKAVFEAGWLISWRYLSPYSPFPNGRLQRLPGTARFKRLRLPFVCGMWRDHALVEIRPEMPA